MQALGAAVRLWTVGAALLVGVAPLQGQDTSLERDSGAATTVERAVPAPALVTLDLRDVSLRAALKAVEAQAGVSLVYATDAVPLERRVSLHVREVSAEEALRAVLRGTDVEVRAMSPGQILLVRHRGREAAPADPPRPDTAFALVSGRVTDSLSGAPVARAVVSVDEPAMQTLTDEAGEFRLTTVPEGERVIRVRRIGYLQGVRRVTLAGGAQRVDFVVAASPGQLNQVVVTGTAVPTEVKAIPTPISVVTGNDIEQAGLARVDDILRGMVPGALKVGTGERDGYPGISFRGGTDFGQDYATSPMKVYVDGVEMAYADAISQLDPRIVDRIEITRGPQASTIYGSGAIGGVIQIFTKKGSTSGHTEVSAQLSAGGLQSQWRDKPTLQQDHALSVSGGTSELSYQLTGAYNATGAWAPEYKSRRASYFASARHARGPLEVDLTGSLSQRQYDIATIEPYVVEQIRSRRWKTPFDAFYTTPFYPDVQRQSMTMGMNATYTTRSWWQQHLTLGYDRYDNPRGTSAPRRLTPADTLRSFSEFTQARASAAYSSTFTATLGGVASGSVVLGGDHWSTAEDVESGSKRSDGTFMAGRSYISKPRYSNSGVWAQAQLGLGQSVFLTAGVRGDRNDNFGTENGTAVAPRVGLAYTRDMGFAVAKARVSYGEAIRAPLPYQKDESRINLPTSLQEANPDLGPETQRGYDAGAEFYFGARTSVKATYYNQHIDDLISTVVLSAPGDTTEVSRYENLGRVANTGWELEGSAGRGPVTALATYSIFNSVAKRVAPAALGDGFQQYHVGDRLLMIPRSSGGLTLRFDRGRTGLSVGATYVGSFRNYDYIRYYSDRFGPTATTQAPRTYIVDYPSSVKWTVGLTQRLTPHVAGFIHIDNVGNSYAAEIDNTVAMQGRLTMAGVRLKL